MLTLAFVGLIFTDVRSSGAWNYWRAAVPCYALMALWLSWYLRRKDHSLSPVTLWHELLHWIGLVAAVFLISFYVEQGILGRFEAALATLTLISFAVFAAGVYIETTFLFIGIILGLFGAIVAFLEEYLYALSLPVILVGLGLIGWTLWHKHHKKTP